MRVPARGGVAVARAAVYPIPRFFETATFFANIVVASLHTAKEACAAVRPRVAHVADVLRHVFAGADSVALRASQELPLGERSSTLDSSSGCAT